MTDECTHAERVLLLIDCGAGGQQFRRYCLACWQDLEGAIPHARAKAELRGEHPIPGNLEQLHLAREQFLRRLWESRRQTA